MVQVKADTLSPFSDDEHDPDSDANADDDRAGPASWMPCSETEGATRIEKRV